MGGQTTIMARAIGTTNNLRDNGPARMFVLILGITYLAVAALESYLGATNRQLGSGEWVLGYGMMHNVVHWLTGLLLVGSYFAGEGSARIVARFVGILFTLVLLLGIFAPGWTGDLLGHGGPLAWSYNAIHALTAVGALVAGFIGTTRRHGTTTRV